jgi:hypothetical protein
MSFEHILLTRLNVQLTDDQGPASEDWLAARLPLFRDVCVPSVRRQRASPLKWFVFCDARTQGGGRDEIEKLAADGVFEPVWVKGRFGPERVNEAIAEGGLGRRRFLITSRLDCDDAIAPHFCETVQEHFEPTRTAYFVNLLFGYQMSSGRFYLRPYIANPFVSHVEQRSPGRPWDTVFCLPHHLITDRPLKQVRCRPAWLQVIHDRNLANKVRGVRFPARGPAEVFNVPAHYPVSEEPLLAMVADQVASGTRFLVDSLRDETTRRRLLNVVAGRLSR